MAMKLKEPYSGLEQEVANRKKDLAEAKEVVENQLRLKTEFEEREKDFISVASHGLQTPLALIRGYMTMLVSGNYGNVDAEAKKYIAECLNGTDRLVRLVKDLLSTSRIASGRLKLNKTSFDLADLINGVIFSFQKVAKQAHLELSYKGVNKILVKADRDRTIEIVTNLVDNAIKYTKRGTVVVSVSKERSYAVVEVVDTGVGIKKNAFPHVFDKFYFSEALVSKQQESTGLGLYIVKSLVEVMGGTIRLESKEGQGSTFTFTLPLSKTNV